MADFDKTIELFRTYLLDIEAKAHERLARIINNPHLPKDQKDQYQAGIEVELESNRKNMEKTLNDLVQFPPQHQRHYPKLTDFHMSGPYEKSVFIMTKFPEGKSEIDKQLSNVIEAVKKSITGCGYIPRIASEKNYQDWLWDNIELFLCGCKKGVAIVEGKYKKELNPNVTMEWGWMRGMGKEVLYLVESDFKLERADLSGLIKESFHWDAPEEEIDEAIRKWLRS